MTTKREIAVRLLSIQKQSNNWLDQINAIDHIEIDTPLGFQLLDMALDILGVQKDNTQETNACQIASRTGAWPDGVYCRDWAYFAFSLMVVKHDDIDGFIRLASGELEIPETVGPNDEDMEAYLYT